MHSARVKCAASGISETASLATRAQAAAHRTRAASVEINARK